MWALTQLRASDARVPIQLLFSPFEVSNKSHIYVDINEYQIGHRVYVRFGDIY